MVFFFIPKLLKQVLFFLSLFYLDLNYWKKLFKKFRDDKYTFKRLEMKNEIHAKFSDRNNILVVFSFFFWINMLYEIWAKLLI